MRHAGERAQRFRDRVVADACRARGGRRRGGVLAVVQARDERLGRQRIVGRELDAVEPEPARHDLRARALEDAQLRVAVRLEGPVPVEVIGLEVEQHRDIARELVHVLELEARELADDGRARLDLLGDVGERAADVAGDLDAAAGRAQDRAEQLGRRRLPVRAGHADQRVAVQQPVAELDLAPDRDAARTRSRGERRLGRHPGALHDELDTLQQRLLLRSGTNFDAGLGEPARVGNRRPGRPRRPPPRAARARAPPPAPTGRARSRARAAAATPQPSPVRPAVSRSRRTPPPKGGVRAPARSVRGQA